MSASNDAVNSPIIQLLILYSDPDLSVEDRKKMLLDIFISSISAGTPIRAEDILEVQRTLRFFREEEGSSKGIHNLSKTNNRARCNYQVSPNFTTGYVYVTRGHATERFAIDDNGEWIDQVTDWIMCNLRTQFKYQLKNPP